VLSYQSYGGPLAATPSTTVSVKVAGVTIGSFTGLTSECQTGLQVTTTAGLTFTFDLASVPAQVVITGL